jgi:uncharacterized phage protein (TIGR02218 family)
MSTLSELEVSIEASRPIELYEFQLSGTTYRRTSSEGTVTFNGVDYAPLAIKRTSYQEAKEQRSTAVTVTIPTSDEIAANFIAVQPSYIMNVTIYRIQPNSVPVNASLIMFDGYVSSVAFKNEICEMRCIPNNELFNREMPRFSYQGLCNHILYDSGCGVSEGSYQHSGKVLGVTDNVLLTIQSLPTTGSPFIGGYVSLPDGSEKRLIIDQSGTQVRILYPFKQTVSGGTVYAYQGCDHSVQTCAQKFNNVLNYGGFPFVPSINPFNKQQLTKE